MFGCGSAVSGVARFGRVGLFFRPIKWASTSRRGQHEVMMRGTFANNRISNEMVHGIEGGMSC